MISPTNTRRTYPVNGTFDLELPVPVTKPPLFPSSDPHCDPCTNTCNRQIALTDIVFPQSEVSVDSFGRFSLDQRSLRWFYGLGESTPLGKQQSLP